MANPHHCKRYPRSDLTKIGEQQNSIIKVVSILVGTLCQEKINMGDNAAVEDGCPYKVAEIEMNWT